MTKFSKKFGEKFQQQEHQQKYLEDDENFSHESDNENEDVESLIEGQQNITGKLDPKHLKDEIGIIPETERMQNKSILKQGKYFQDGDSSISSQQYYKEDDYQDYQIGQQQIQKEAEDQGMQRVFKNNNNQQKPKAQTLNVISNSSPQGQKQKSATDPQLVNTFTKLDDDKKVTNNDSYTKKGDKEGGVHEQEGNIGGVYYIDKDKRQLALIKRDDKKRENDVAEYIASKLFQQLVPNSSPDVSLVEGPDNKTYLQSNYISGYQDAWKRFNPKDKGRSPKKEFLKIYNVKNCLLKKNKGGQYKYNNYEPIIVGSLLVGDFSIHSGNFGMDDDGKMYRIDFGAAFRKLDREIDPNQPISNHTSGFSKNYFTRDHPEERRFTTEFSEELKKQSRVNLDNTINEIFDNLNKGFTKKEIDDFMKRDSGYEGNTIAEYKERFKEIMRDRQQSARDFATEIELGLLRKISKKLDKRYKDSKGNDIGFEELGQDNPQYLKDVFHKNKTAKINGKNKDKAFNNQLIRLIECSSDMAQGDNTERFNEADLQQLQEVQKTFQRNRSMTISGKDDNKQQQQKLKRTLSF